MFERRLKIFLGILLVFTFVLVGGAFHVQIIEREYWRDRAADYMRRPQLLETTRGPILDHRKREIAIDVASIDASVDYRAIPKEPGAAWVRQLAVNRVLAHYGDEYRSAERPKRIEMLDAEIDLVKRQIEAMWTILADRMRLLAGARKDELPAYVEQIDEIRQGIIHRIEVRRRFVWYMRYQKAVERVQTDGPASWYKQWLIDESMRSPQIDSFEESLAEESQPHPILRGIDAETNNFLGKHQKNMPGLALEPSTHRYYPYKDVAAHVLGSLSRVARDDLKADPNVGDELRQYYPNDLIGRTGIEALCEPALRGKRGRLEKFRGDDAVISREDPTSTDGVQITLDIELQQEIQNKFREVRTKLPDGSTDVREMHGAAVVIDVATGEARALVSHPSYDLNTLDETYGALLADEIQNPLLNRATRSQLVPGSTVKPIVGIGGVTQGIVTADQGIECLGHLVLNGKRFSYGRCWTASKFGNEASHVHHGIPWNDPHPTGFLNLADAIQRSCNVYFETIADRMGLEGLTFWFQRFGLGRPTGVGIVESRGTLPDDYLGDNPRGAAWFSAIGQSPVTATPIQMANVAATIARDGVWKRPRLVSNQTLIDRKHLPLVDGKPIPDEVNLELSPAALAAVHDGMFRVVNTVAGTGNNLIKELGPDGRERPLHSSFLFNQIAAKTGTAQASKFSIKARNAAGDELLDENGKTQFITFEPDSFAWYMGTGKDGKDLSHAWYIGYAPARGKPQIAFSVLVEYGGSGGNVAATIARGIIEACIEAGYLQFPTSNE